jgi:translation initiation factor 1
MGDNKIVWSDESGDLRKKDEKGKGEAKVELSALVLKVRRLTSGKGRTVIEISALPNNADWCKTLAADLKKSLGVGGTYKEGAIEIHVDKLERVTPLLDKKLIKWKKTGG